MGSTSYRKELRKIRGTAGFDYSGVRPEHAYRELQEKKTPCFVSLISQRFKSFNVKEEQNLQIQGERHHFLTSFSPQLHTEMSLKSLK